MSPVRRGGLRATHPAQLVAAAFIIAILAGAALLLLPVASAGPGRTSLLTALFTSTSAVCVTGLIVVDTPAYWSTFGEAVILGLIQIGGLGIMTLASLVALVISRRMGLRQRMVAQAESGALQLGDVRRVVKGVLLLTAAFEVTILVVLTGRLWLSYGEPFGQALWLGLFHSVSAFNNAGFALYADSLSGFVTDGWISLSVAVGVIAGGLGFPVWVDLWRHRLRTRRWTMHTRLTLFVVPILIVVGTVAVLAFEWTNPATLGELDVAGKGLAGFFQGVTPRTAGFNTIDYTQMREATWFVTDVLMFIGGGSASTAGGIKVTTFALLGFVIWSEIIGERDVNVFGRRAAEAAQRQALTIALLAVAAVVTGSFILMVSNQLSLSRSLFEVISAFATVGLSTGVTPTLNELGQLVTIGLMFFGRIGPITVFAALVLRERRRLYRYPEERPIIG